MARFFFFFFFWVVGRSFFLTQSLPKFPSTEWETCQNELDSCTGGTPQQQFLGCYVSLWHKCPTKVLDFCQFLKESKLGN